MGSTTNSSAERKNPSVLHRNAPLSVEGRRRLVERCQTRPLSHVAAEMGISRACASKWMARYREHGELGLLDRPSVPHHQPTATPAETVTRIETLRRTRKWSAARIAHELEQAASGAPNAETLTREAAYFRHNHLRMNYLEMREELWPIGSGMVESGAKQFKTRFCGPGMRWSRKGAEHLLPIRSAILSRRFNQRWAEAQNLPPA